MVHKEKDWNVKGWCVMYIYLSGSLSYLHKIGKFEKATEWRNQIEYWAKDNNIKTFNPADTFEKDIISNRSSNMIVDQNIYFLYKCDMMIVNLNHILQSPGTMFEMFYFKQKFKPVVAFFGEGMLPRDFSSHIEYCISQKCRDTDEVIELISTMFHT